MEQQKAADLIHKIGIQDCRRTVSGVLSTARGIDTWLLKGDALPLLSRSDAAILAKACSIMKGVGKTLEQARAEKQRFEEQEKQRLIEFDARRKQLLRNSLPPPSDPSEYRNVLLWRLAGDVFFNETLSDAYFPDGSMVLRDLRRYQSSHRENLLNYVQAWWLEVHLYLCDYLWPRDQEPDPLALDNLLYQFSGKWVRRVEMMHEEILSIFDNELQICQAGNVVRL